VPDFWRTANKIFAVSVAAVSALPSATVGEVFAVCLGHTANSWSPVVVAATVKGMNRQSAPGPDGFGPSFYGAAWTEIKSQVMEVVSAFHPEDLELERINMSYMVLVPKKSGA